jgi:hypothetical protein
MSDEADAALVHVVARDEMVERGAVPRDLVTDAPGIGRRIRRIAGPRKPALRQDRYEALVAGQRDRLVDELAAIPVGRLGVEPVEEENARSAAARGRLDEVRVRVGDADVMDSRAIALGRWLRRDRLNPRFLLNVRRGPRFGSVVRGGALRSRAAG